MSRYIDSDKLLNRFMDYICHDFACSDCKARYYPSGVCRVDKMLREFPTADVKPVVKARWVDDFTSDWVCTNCLQPSPSKKYNYCPNCGAEMEL